MKFFTFVLLVVLSQNLFAPDAFEDGLFLYQQVLSCHKKLEDLEPVQQEWFVLLYQINMDIMEEEGVNSKVIPPEVFLKEIEDGCKQYWR